MQCQKSQTLSLYCTWFIQSDNAMIIWKGYFIEKFILLAFTEMPKITNGTGFGYSLAAYSGVGTTRTL